MPDHFAQLLSGFHKPDLSVKPASYPKGPALVYTAWAGKACGTAHDLHAIAKAAHDLHVPLYVINSSMGSIADKPGTPFPNVTTLNQSIQLLDHYNLTMQDTRVRLIGTDGNVVPTPDINSHGNLIGMFKPLIDRMRPAHKAPGRY